MANEVMLYGRHAVLAALVNKKRKIKKLLCVRENLHEVKNFAPSVVDKKEIDRLLPVDAVHQGFLLYAEKLEGVSIEEIIQNASDDCHVLILDQITDPQNIGAIIRSAAAFNTLAVIVQDKNSPQESGVMAKAAAGMVEIVPVARVTNLSRAIEQLKKAGFWAVGLDSHASMTIDKMNKKGKIMVVMGSEGKGMRRLVEENCDFKVKLPMSDKVESLNVSVATAIVLYEMSKNEHY